MKGTITFTYDASGNKLKKQTVDNTTSGTTITTTTTYINGFVYESKVTTPADANNRIVLLHAVYLLKIIKTTTEILRLIAAILPALHQQQRPPVAKCIN